MSAIDLSQLQNPYDFGNPVAEPELFSGRSEELKEIRYYLDQANRARRPINLALLGDRAAGKTSLLNMIERAAADRGFCIARVDLNEGDARSELAFFYKLFDSLFNAACHFECARELEAPRYSFGGRTGKTFDAYLDMTSAYEIPSDRTFCPFIFPLQYAKAKARGVENASVSDQSFRDDLARISEEVGRPIVILFDECNVLSPHRVLLQMLRNVFMNTPGYMLVFTGTPDLFPVMDEVFSPIVRQFKKIEVRPFQIQEDTDACIRKPLEQIGIGNPLDVFEDVTLRELQRIHELTGGRPYEIQLLCHLMFKQVQQGKSTKMALSVDILDDVLRELSRGQDIYARPVIREVRRLSERELRALSWLCSCVGRATFEQLWLVEYGAHGEARWTRSELQELAQKFAAAGILSLEESTVRFAGDDFDRLYSRYYARKVQVPLNISSISYELHVTLTLNAVARKYGLRNLPVTVDFADGEPGRLTAGLAAVSGARRQGLPDVDAAGMLQRVCGEEAAAMWELHPSFAAAVHVAMLEHGADVNEFEAAVVSFRTDAPCAELVYYVPSSSTPLRDEFIRDYEAMAERVATLGGSLRATWLRLPLRAASQTVELVAEHAGDRVKRMLAKLHGERVAHEYITNRDSDAALFHARLVIPLAESLDAQNANNVAFMLIRTGAYREATKLLRRALALPDSDVTAPLLSYNLGVANLLDGAPSEAVEALGRSVQLIAEQNDRDIQTGCLLVPRYVGDRWVTEDLWEPDLGEIARQLLASIRRLGSPG